MLIYGRSIVNVSNDMESMLLSAISMTGACSANSLARLRPQEQTTRTFSKDRMSVLALEHVERCLSESEHEMLRTDNLCNCCFPEATIDDHVHRAGFT